MSILFAKGFSPDRWKQCTEVRLEKDPGDSKVHGLLIIVLLEADLNLEMRTIWMERLFTQAEKSQFIPKEWVNRKNKNTLDYFTMKL